MIGSGQDDNQEGVVASDCNDCHAGGTDGGPAQLIVQQYLDRIDLDEKN